MAPRIGIAPIGLQIEPITATVSSPAQVSLQNNTADFTITYTDNAGSTFPPISGSFVEVLFNDSSSFAQQVGTFQGGTSTATVDYRFSGPERGWSASDDGTYDVEAFGFSTFHDNAENNAPTGTIGSTAVDLTPPTAVGDSASTGTDAPVSINVLANDSPGDSPRPGAFERCSFLPPSNGSVTGPDAAGNLTYTPANGFVGVDRFTYTVTNQSGLQSAAALVRLSVTAAPPSITQQPQDQTVTAGGNASFTVAAAGTAPLSYQWQFNGTNLSGANGSTLTLNNVGAGAGRRIRRRRQQHRRPGDEQRGALTVNAAVVGPSITQQPQDQSVTTGSDATFTVGADGTGPLSYQWQFNGNNIDGANGSTFTVPGASGAAAGAYAVVVSNSAGAVTSNAAKLTVTSAAVAPSIVQQPTGAECRGRLERHLQRERSRDGPAELPVAIQRQSHSGAHRIVSRAERGEPQSGGRDSVVVANGVGSLTSTPAQLSVAPGELSAAGPFTFATGRPQFWRRRTGFHGLCDRGRRGSGGWQDRPRGL